MAAPCFTKEKVLELIEREQIAPADLGPLARSIGVVPNLPNLAAKFGHLDLLKKLPFASPDEDSLDEKTPLHDACQFGQVHVVEWLVQQESVDINNVDHSTWTPAMYAARYGHLAAIKVLHGKRADFTIVDENDQTALIIADQNGHNDVCDFLR